MTNFGEKKKKREFNGNIKYIFFELTHGGHFPKKYSKGPAI